MPVATTQLYEIKNFQTWGGRNILNIYWYLRTGAGVATAAEVITMFIDDVQVQIREVQGINLVHTAVEAEDVLVINDFATQGQTGITGLRVGAQAMPPFTTVPFRLVRTDKETHHGRKAIAGMDEDAWDGSDYTTAMVTELDLLATELSAVQSITGVGTMTPVIVRRPVAPSTDWIYNIIASTLYGDPSTQNSRKRKIIT